MKFNSYGLLIFHLLHSFGLSNSFKDQQHLLANTDFDPAPQFLTSDDFTNNDISKFLSAQIPQSIKKIHANISPPGAHFGCVIASESRHAPDYFYHWIRDSALTLGLLSYYYSTPIENQLEIVSYDNLQCSVEEASPQDNHQQISIQTYKTCPSFLPIFFNFTAFSSLLQQTDNPSGAPTTGGLGEPKFNVDGSPFLHDWGRPQNDGPAVRALVITSVVAEYLDWTWDQQTHTWTRSDLTNPEDYNKKLQSVSEKIYTPTMPPNSPLKRDLEYVSKSIFGPSFDIWEEVDAVSHFYTVIMQYLALKTGERFVRGLNDTGASDWYVQKANEAKRVALNHIRDHKIVPSIGILNQVKKESDMSVILAVLHFEWFKEQHLKRYGEIESVVSPCSREVSNSLLELVGGFKLEYGINRKIFWEMENGVLGPAIGRYPNDVYDGVGMSRGNPWVLATAAVAEWCYMCANEIDTGGFLDYEKVIERLYSLVCDNNAESNQRRTLQDWKFILMHLGDSFLRRIKYSFERDSSGKGLSEQIHRDTAEMMGAKDLTWSHVSLISAAQRRWTTIKRK